MRAAVLALHANRFRVLFEKTAFVQHQNRIRIPKMRDRVGPQVLAHRVRIPVHPAEQRLHASRDRVAYSLGQLPAVLALDRAKQATQIRRRGSARPKRGANRAATQSSDQMPSIAAIPEITTAKLDKSPRRYR